MVALGGLAATVAVLAATAPGIWRPLARAIATGIGALAPGETNAEWIETILGM